MSSDESDDLPLPISVRGLQSSHPHIWCECDELTTCSDDGRNVGNVSTPVVSTGSTNLNNMKVKSSSNMKLKLTAVINSSVTVVTNNSSGFDGISYALRCDEKVLPTLTGTPTNKSQSLDIRNQESEGQQNNKVLKKRVNTLPTILQEERHRECSSSSKKGDKISCLASLKSRELDLLECPTKHSSVALSDDVQDNQSNYNIGGCPNMLLHVSNDVICWNNAHPDRTHSKSIRVETDKVLTARNGPALPTVVQASCSKFIKLNGGAESPEKLLPVSRDESGLLYDLAIKTDPKSSGVGREKKFPVGHVYLENLLDASASDVKGDTTHALSSPGEKSRKRLNLDFSSERTTRPVEVINNHSTSVKIEVSNKTQNPPVEELIGSPRSARLAQACFGERRKRTRLSRIIFSTENHCDVTNSDKTVQSQSNKISACDKIIQSPEVNLDLSGIPILRKSSSKSPKYQSKASSVSSSSPCSIGTLFLDEDPVKIRPPPKKKSPSKQATKVELLYDDGLWCKR